MSEKIVLDDGSVASKLLQHENKDAKVIKVNQSDSLIEQFTKLDPKQDNRIYLPFTTEDLVFNNEERRVQIQKVEALGFKNQVVLPYEGNDEKTIRQRAKEVGIDVGDSKEILKGEKVEPDTERHKLSYPEHNGVVKTDEERKPYKSVPTEDRKV
jgi:hypothetical protein